jgi:hypothetical protein
VSAKIKVTNHTHLIHKEGLIIPFWEIMTSYKLSFPLQLRGNERIIASTSV